MQVITAVGTSPTIEIGYGGVWQLEKSLGFLSRPTEIGLPSGPKPKSFACPGRPTMHHVHPGCEMTPLAVSL